MTYSMTVKEMKKLLENKKDNEILDFDIDVYNGDYIDEIEINVYCRNLDTKNEKQIIKMADEEIHLYK